MKPILWMKVWPPAAVVVLVIAVLCIVMAALVGPGSHDPFDAADEVDSNTVGEYMAYWE